LPKSVRTITTPSQSSPRTFANPLSTSDKAAGSPKSVRGIVTNVSNYNPWRHSTCPALTSPSQTCDEERYINAFAPKLRAEGFPAHFIVDTGRSGKQPTGQIEWGDWCNVQGAGFGVRPTTSTGSELVDAFVWVKPGGEVCVLRACGVG